MDEDECGGIDEVNGMDKSIPYTRIGKIEL